MQEKRERQAKGAGRRGRPDEPRGWAAFVDLARRYPFQWILFMPLVTTPLTILVLTQIGNVCHQEPGIAFTPGDNLEDVLCPTPFALLSLLPGVLNLLPCVGLRARQPRARQAAGIAALLGALRLGLPMLDYLGNATLHSGEVDYYHNAFFAIMPIGFQLSAALWVATLLAFVGWRLATRWLDAAA